LPKPETVGENSGERSHRAMDTVCLEFEDHLLGAVTAGGCRPAALVARSSAKCDSRFVSRMIGQRELLNDNATVMAAVAAGELAS
jgi:hypothetical protein